MKLTEETGVLVFKPEEGEGLRMRSPESGEEPGQTRVMLRRSPDAAGEPGADVAFERKIEISEDGARGGGKRRLTLKTGGELEVGTLEIELLDQ
jgi:hypothetical protein